MSKDTGHTLLELHSPLGPSSADRWINCPGSVKATEDLPDVTSQFAAEGTFAHYVSEIMRNEGKSAKEMIGYKAKFSGFEFEVSASDAGYIEQFVDYVADHEFDEQLVEAMVTYDAWVDGGFGTLDAGLLDDGTSVVVDLKYGKGIQVFAEDNSQLKMYALGMFQEYGHLYDMKEFKLVIHQPRLGHVDEWVIPIEDLLKWANEVVEPAADLALGPDAPFKAGTWCQWCKIKGTCRTRAETMQAGLLDELDGEVLNPNEMTDEEIGAAASLAPMMLKFAKDVMEAVEKRVLKGHHVIGADGEAFKMVMGRSNRAWKNAEAAEQAMRNYKVKVADMFTKKLIGPAGAEKVLGKGHPLLLAHVIKPKGKPVLVPGSDKREAYVEADISELDDE
jgi:hypothetical protein